MFCRKKEKTAKVLKLSDEAVLFIKEYLLKEKEVSVMIDCDLLDDFLNIAFDWESLTVDENGKEKDYDYPNRQRNEQADRFVSEVSGKWASGDWTVDFDDLNKRLGLS